MPGHKTGGYVEEPEESPRERKSLYLILQTQPSAVMIFAKGGGHTIVPGGLGFKHDGDVALNAKREFAAGLYEVSLELDQKIVEHPPNLPDPSEPLYEQSLDAALTLDQGATLLALQKLRQCGRAFRGRLDKGMVTALKNFGFPQNDPPKEPALTFANNEHAPILWDMMYEEEKPGAPLNWENFWGFRVPITHWESISRHNEIRLKKGLFSAIDQTLNFATSEVALLAGQLNSSLPHKSLSDAVKERAKQKLCELRKHDDAQVDAWFAAQADDCWLSEFLQELRGENEQKMAEFLTVSWKQDTVREIFTDPHFAYELVHFACHCEPGKISELITQLNINIAGEDVSLDVASMTDPREWTSEEPGPLVFLNACGTGQQSATNEPPGFPDIWIKQHGALAVIATLCPVPDLFAHAFALKFYRLLFSGTADPKAPTLHRYLGEVLLETRRHFMEHCGNPLGMAYVLYAAQDVRLETRS
jgi:hypothetical protein